MGDLSQVTQLPRSRTEFRLKSACLKGLCLPGPRLPAQVTTFMVSEDLPSSWTSEHKRLQMQQLSVHSTQKREAAALLRGVERARSPPSQVPGLTVSPQGFGEKFSP